MTDALGPPRSRRSRVRRRGVLSALVAGTAWLAGCGDHPSRTPESPSTDRRTRATAALPYAPSGGGAALARPRGVAVENRSEASRYVTVVVLAGDDAVFTDSQSVAAGERIFHSGLVAVAGTYRVVVETARGDRTVREWTVRPGLHDLLVRVGETLTTTQFALCRRRCGALRTDETPVEESIASDTRTGGTLTAGTSMAAWSSPATPEDALPVDVAWSSPVWAVNASTRPVRARVALSADGDGVVDAPLRVPGRTTVAFALSDRGAFDLRVESAGVSRALTWRAPETDRVTVALASDPVTVTCAIQRATPTVANLGDVPREIRLRVRRDGRDVDARRIRVVPDASVDLPPLVENAGDYRLVVDVVGGERIVTDWRVCGPSTPTIVVGPGGGVSVSSVVPGRAE